jgi:HK97 family phage prohead protease
MQNAMFRMSGMDAMPDSREIRGYGIVFNSDSTPMYVFDEERGVVKVVERITKESIERADLSDMVATFNHNFDYILGRTSNSTMDVRIEDKGVFYSVKPSKTSYADDLLENLRAGNITGSSFYFSMDSEQGYDFKERADGMLEATPKRITKVYEMGPVTSPAYPATTSERRSMLHDQAEAFLKQKRTAQEAEQPQEPAMTEDEQKLRAFYKRKKYKKLKGA